jgi:hypothetical protein
MSEKHDVDVSDNGEKVTMMWAILQESRLLLSTVIVMKIQNFKKNLHQLRTKIEEGIA